MLMFTVRQMCLFLQLFDSKVICQCCFFHFPESANIPGGAFRQFRGLLKTQCTLCTKKRVKDIPRHPESKNKIKSLKP